MQLRSSGAPGSNRQPNLGPFFCRFRPGKSIKPRPQQQVVRVKLGTLDTHASNHRSRPIRKKQRFQSITAAEVSKALQQAPGRKREKPFVFMCWSTTHEGPHGEQMKMHWAKLGPERAQTKLQKRNISCCFSLLFASLWALAALHVTSARRASVAKISQKPFVLLLFKRFPKTFVEPPRGQRQKCSKFIWAT